MKGRSLILSATLILLAGLVLILTYKTTRSDGIVIVGGILFLAVGILNLFTYMAERPSKKQIAQDQAEGRRTRGNSSLTSTLTWVTSGAAVILGLCLLVFTSTFTSLVTFVFALLIALGAIYQFYLLAIGSRPLRLPSWLFVVPVLMLGAAVYVFMQKSGTEISEHLIMLVTGISFVLLGATMYIESVLIGTANRRAITRSKEAAADSSRHPSVADDKSAVIDVHPLDDDTK